MYQSTARPGFLNSRDSYYHLYPGLSSFLSKFEFATAKEIQTPLHNAILSLQ